MPHSQPDPSPRVLFLETILPREIYARVFLFLVAVKALGYWLVSSLQHPQEPLSILAMYRVGDIQVYPAIASLSQLNLGENIVFEHLQEGLLPPFPPLFPHALFVGLFGELGFVVADVIIALSYYVALSALLRLFGISKSWSACASLLVVSGGLGFIAETLESIQTHPIVDISIKSLFGLLCAVCLCSVLLSFRSSSATHRTRLIQLGWVAAVTAALLYLISTDSALWSWRIPRPFVTEVLFLICVFRISVAVTGCNHKSSRPWIPWFWLAIAFSLLFQSQLYSGLSTSLIIASVVLYSLVLSLAGQDLKSGIKSLSVFLSTAAVCCAPFLLSRLLEHPDYPVRLGVFSVERGNIHLVPSLNLYFLTGAALILGWFLITALQSEFDSRQSSGKQKVWILCGFCLASLFALPVSAFVLGKSVQVYHFSEHIEKVIYLTILVFFLSTRSRRSLLFPDRGPRIAGKRVRTIQVLAVILLSLVATVSTALQYSQVSGHMRPDFEEYQSLTNYRSDFLEVSNELSIHRSQGAQVIGTLDAQLFSWWVSFQNGQSFIPDPALTRLPDSVVEYRLAAFCRMLELGSDEFRALINQPYVTNFWLSHDKYQASQAHTFAPLSDYDPAVQTRIGQTDINSSWDLAIPNSEQARLLLLYESVDLQKVYAKLRLDLIVLTKDAGSRNFVPSSGLFELSFENGTFRIWTKTSGQQGLE